MTRPAHCWLSYPCATLHCQTWHFGNRTERSAPAIFYISFFLKYGRGTLKFSPVRAIRAFSSGLCQKHGLEGAQIKRFFSLALQVFLYCLKGGHDASH